MYVICSLPTFYLHLMRSFNSLIGFCYNNHNRGEQSSKHLKRCGTREYGVHGRTPKCPAVRGCLLSVCDVLQVKLGYASGRAFMAGSKVGRLLMSRPAIEVVVSRRGGSASFDEFGKDCRGRASFPMRVRPTLVGRRVGGGLGWCGEARRAAAYPRQRFRPTVAHL